MSSIEFFKSDTLQVRYAEVIDVPVVVELLHSLWLEEGSPAGELASNKLAMEQSLLTCIGKNDPSIVAIVACAPDMFEPEQGNYKDVQGVIVCCLTKGYWVGSTGGLKVSSTAPKHSALRLMEAGCLHYKDHNIEHVWISTSCQGKRGERVRGTYENIGFRAEFVTHTGTVSAALAGITERLK